MADDKKPNQKRSFSNSFIYLVIGVILAAILIQNFMESQTENVSFSYQLEHLVNLDLIQPEDSRKVASNNNLVTFAGKFRENETPEGRQRYRYLQLLDESHELSAEAKRLEADRVRLKNRVIAAADFYLKLAGISPSKNGYQVIDELFDTPEHDNQVVITKVSPKAFTSVLDVNHMVQELQPSDSPEHIQDVMTAAEQLIRNMRTPLLGIGDVGMKATLQHEEEALSAASASSPEEQIKVCKEAVSQAQLILTTLNHERDHMRLSQLRSVRNYTDVLEQHQKVVSKIEDTAAKLDQARRAVADTVWYFNNEELSTRALERQDPEIFHQWFLDAKEEWTGFPAVKGDYFKAPDQPSNKVLERTFKSEEIAPNYFSYLISIAPIFLILFLLYFAFSRQMKGMGSSAMDFGKSPAKLYPKGSTKVTFKDVAGIDEALEELQEIVEFLKNPHKFTALGGRIPKGVLCIGPPGTGKTLVAKAVAGEADCPFFSISGSDFVEMFVGVGASRIRKMFEDAKKNAPCIIFMDEIDAVGRHRGAGFGGGHDEREQTLNQLLVEMDGFDTQEGIIIIAATNRPDVLDKALLRPGRFDRQVYIPLPDIKGRFEILKVHARRIKLDNSIDLMMIARSTPGCSGADLQNLLNESALLAARKGQIAVTEQDVTEARDKVLYGKERRSLELDLQEKITTAYHESGHTIVGLCVKHADPVDKVTIIPRGFSLGSTLFLPKKNRVSYWRSELLDQLAVLMGGRAAEEAFVGDVSSGAKQDLERATQMVRSMVCEWGMSDVLGTVTYDERTESGQFLGGGGYREKLYSEKTAQEIDGEMKRILGEAYQRAVSIIEEHRDVVQLMQEMLIEFETLDAKDVEKMLHGEWSPEEKRKKLAEIAQSATNKNTSDEVKTSPPPPPPLPVEDQLAADS